jgi:hypothetical protein
LPTIKIAHELHELTRIEDEVHRLALIIKKIRENFTHTKIAAKKHKEGVSHKETHKTQRDTKKKTFPVSNFKFFAGA